MRSRLGWGWWPISIPRPMSCASASCSQGRADEGAGASKVLEFLAHKIVSNIRELEA